MMKSDVTNWQRVPRLRREKAEMVYAAWHEQSMSSLISGQVYVKLCSRKRGDV